MKNLYMLIIILNGSVDFEKSDSDIEVLKKVVDKLFEEVYDDCDERVVWVEGECGLEFKSVEGEIYKIIKVM